MSYRNVFATYITDLSVNVAMLNSFITMYNISITSVNQISVINGMHKRYIEKAIERMNAVGHLTDDLIQICQSSIDVYNKYCFEKNMIMCSYFSDQNIYKEIQEEIRKAGSNE